MEWILLASALLATAFSALLGSFFIKGTFNFLTKKSNGNTERFSSQSKPIYGGILFYSVFLLCSLIYFFSPLNTQDDTNTFIALMITVGISFFMGLADDLLNTPPLFKFIVQFVCAFVLIKTGVVIEISPIEWINYTITFLKFLVHHNQIKFLLLFLYFFLRKAQFSYDLY